MNIIPSTSKENGEDRFVYVMSDQASDHSSPMKTVGTVLIHNVDSLHLDLRKIVSDYLSFGIHELICINCDGSDFDEELVSLFPHVRFWKNLSDTHEKKSHTDNLGEMLNMVMADIDTDIVFVSWSNIDPYGMSSQQLMKSTQEFPFCKIPTLEDREGKVLPSTFFPKKKLNGYAPLLKKDNSVYPYALFPLDGVGIFNRKKFFQIGGFDSHIDSFYWQLFDLGMRAYANNMIIPTNSYYRLRVQDGITNVKANKNFFYNLVCMKARIGMHFVHFVQFIVKGLLRCTLQISLLKHFYNNPDPIRQVFYKKVKEYWK